MTLEWPQGESTATYIGRLQAEIERLRQWPNMCPDAADAADEIERIGALWRAAENNEQLRAAMLTCQAAEIERLRAEVERLRTALQEIAHPYLEPGPDVEAEIELLRTALQQIMECAGCDWDAYSIAERALEPKRHDT